MHLAVSRYRSNSPNIRNYSPMKSFPGKMAGGCKCMNALQMMLLTICGPNFSCEFQLSGRIYFLRKSLSLQIQSSDYA
jgi:hypothetical protein